MKNGECPIFFGNLVIGINNPQFPRILKRMNPETEQIEETSQGPHVCLLTDGFVAIKIYHFWRSVHGCRVTLNLGDREEETENCHLSNNIIHQHYHVSFSCTSLSNVVTRF